MRGTSVRHNVTLAVSPVNQPPDLRLNPYFVFSESAEDETVLLEGAAFGFTSAPVDITDESAQVAQKESCLLNIYWSEST